MYRLNRVSSHLRKWAVKFALLRTVGEGALCATGISSVGWLWAAISRNQFWPHQGQGTAFALEGLIGVSFGYFLFCSAVGVYFFHSAAENQRGWNDRGERKYTFNFGRETNIFDVFAPSRAPVVHHHYHGGTTKEGEEKKKKEEGHSVLFLMAAVVGFGMLIGSAGYAGYTRFKKLKNKYIQDLGEDLID